MATHTDYFNLEKPESYENYNIAVFNNNADTIDLQMHNNQTSAAKVMVGATSLADGESGRVPTPHAGDEDKYLKGDGTWAAGNSNVEANPSGTPTDTLESVKINNTIYQLPEGGNTEITGDAEGSVISIHDGKLNEPLKACTVDINPVQSGSGTPSPSNIRPISGWTEANITVADATVSPTVSNTYNIEFEDSGSPLTVYGGTLDTVSGVLTVTDGYIASYDGETLPSTWISDRDVYSAGTTPTTGAEVVYKLATPTEVSLTPTEITTLYGNNVIWADSGDMAITYIRDTSIAINDALNQSITPTYSSGTKIADYNVGGQTGAIYVQGAGGQMDTLWTGDVNPTSDSKPTVQLAYPLSGYDYIVVEGYGTYTYYTTDAIYKPVIGRTYVGNLNGEINYCAAVTIINDSNIRLNYWGSAGINTHIVGIYGVKI
ncbi:hypothetical protein SAMN05660484_00029 [Eubacterium ruminantium]|uniref:hypothetical protein n=1 Tax=Eubacterium ruminantium TaxID=42322 RepID=UPI000871508D|nr:hypothetical protein [Eubacterium ruminantium]SCW26624.1 hypothetical protein SAMN05660484_00029 [Eubacterium ruminantium]SDM16728.1 hypothetical protein SAMN04490370_101254 [Eubacterium ruminantium]